MRVAAVIAEFNPLHAGHAHLLAEVRRAGATHIAVVLGGNFTQRGEPALFGKFDRARAALLCGADLVLELPLPYAAAGAQRFARGGVAVAAALGRVDTLAFGSECGDLRRLEGVGRALDAPEVRAALARRLSRGESFPRAQAGAVGEVCGEEAAAVLSGPNDALGLEYLRALGSLGGGITPLPIPRVGAGHGAHAPQAGTASAGALRALALAQGVSAIAPYVPAAAMAVFSRAPVADPSALAAVLLSQLRRLQREALARLPEVSEGIENRLYAAIRRADSLEALYGLVKCKRYTLARVRRLALAAFLGLEEDDSAGPPPYVRVLGANGKGRALLGGARLPLGPSLRRLGEAGPRAARFAALEAAAGDQYALLQSPRGGCGAEYRAGMIRA